MKITPAHDHDDYATGQRHGLPFVDVMDDGGAHLARPAAATPAWTATPPASGSSPTSRRRGDLVGQQGPRDDHRALPAQPRRRGAAPQDAVVRPDARRWRRRRSRPPARGRTRILPERFDKVWEHWLTEIRDWNVSRQLWWGHRIPAWYCPDGHVTVSAAPEGPAACEACGRPAAELRQDPDIFDTWFSSGLWPFSTLGLAGGRRPTWPASTRARSWRRPTTSSSSGSPG